MLIVTHVVGGYGERTIINDVSFKVKKGEFLGILGPNGSGKTTLLNMVTGVHPIRQGSIVINGKNVNTYDPKTLARLIAVLPQLLEQSFTYSVEEIVSLGRYPHQRGLIKTLSRADKEIVWRAMDEVNVAQYADQSIQTLSGGEKQRVYLAQVLAQEPSLLILDEPTNHLDISHQKRLLDTLKDWTITNDLTVVAVFHDLNLASLYSDQILLLDRGTVKSHSRPAVVLNEETIQSVYHTETKKIIHPERSRPLITILPNETKSEEDHVFSFEQIAIDSKQDKLQIVFSAPLKTLSSAVIGAGFSWRTTFINRFVDQNYRCENPTAEMLMDLKTSGQEIDQVVAMMTAAHSKSYSYKLIMEDTFELLIVVTASIGNAVDVSQATKFQDFHSLVGTVNTWVFINAKLPDAAFIQALITATEAKTKAFSTEQIIDRTTNTIATDTATDSTLIAATQRGKKIQSAGKLTSLGKLLGKAVYTCTVQALRKAKNKEHEKS